MVNLVESHFCSWWLELNWSEGLSEGSAVPEVDEMPFGKLILIRNSLMQIGFSLTDKNMKISLITHSNLYKNKLQSEFTLPLCQSKHLKLDLQEVKRSNWWISHW